MSLNVYALGASRNIGYHAALRLLRKGATVTFLLRSLSTLEGDENLQPFVQDGKVHLVSGDALNKEDVIRGWKTAQEASESGRVDLVLFTVGGKPHWHLWKGFQLSTADLCTRSFLNLLTALKTFESSSAPQPKLIVLSSIGITHQSHINLPLLLKPLYGYLLQGPHTDKLGLERILAYSAGWDWSDHKSDQPEPRILPTDWMSKFNGIGEDGSGIKSGWLKHLVVVRPALLTSGVCRADVPAANENGKKEPYRTKEGDLGNGYTVSREDVAHFIVEGVLAHWEEYENKGIGIAY